MLPAHKTPEPTTSPLLAARSTRLVARAVQHRNFAAVVSWLVWLGAVVAFAIWTFFRYRAPAAPSWVGMLIHTSVFAIWTLVMREWFIVRMKRRQRNRNDR